MKETWRKGALLVIACGAGFFLGWGSKTLGAGSVSGEAVARNVSAKAPRPQLNDESGGSKETRNYRTLRAAVGKQLEGGELTGVIERMNDEELRALLEAWEDKPFLDLKLRSKMGMATKLAATELFKRQGIPALEWAEKSGRKDLFSALVEAAACREPKVARAWFDRLVATHGAVSGAYVATAAKQAARMRGSADLLEIEALYKSNMIAKIPEFADGFDHAGYLRNSADEFSCRATLRYLAAADPAAAEQLIRDGLSGQGKVNWSYAGAAALEGRAAMTSEEEAVRWIGGVLGEVDQEARTPLIANIVGRGTSDHRVEALIKGLPGDQDRLELARHLMMKLEPTGQALTALRAMDNDALRVRAIEYRLQAYDSAKLAEPSLRSEVGGKLETLMENLQMADGARQQVRGLLPEAR